MVHCTLHTAHCTLHTAHCTLHTVYAGSELMQNVGKVIVQGGSTIGTFMVIGTGFRC